MQIAWDVPIRMDDGVVLRADVFRPPGEDHVPVLLTYGPYGKGMRFSDHHPEQWARLVDKHPEVLEGSTNKYQAWETPDPERWVAFGYACVRVDSRGAGRSPGFLAPNSPRETQDIYRCIEWAGGQRWSNGRVGMLGISYYACNSWRVAALEDPPPHLAAICPWEGNCDPYREANRHGGILTTWSKNWWASRILPMQHGRGQRGPRNPNNGELVTGPDTLTDAELEANRPDFAPERNPHVLYDRWWQEREVRLENISVPVLSAANWGGAALHLRGNVEGFVRAGSDAKWLEIHGQEHWTEFYGSYGLDLQRRFLDCFLKDDDTEWRAQPRVTLNVRHPGEKFELRGEDDWPLPSTQWTRAFLHDGALAARQAEATGAVQFEAMTERAFFLSEPFDAEAEITGPAAATLFISSTTTDADLFLVLHAFDPTGEEVTFQGAMDPFSSVGKGWLRASHRKLYRALSTEFRPYHAHDEVQPLTPGELYEVQVEIWPTCIVLAPGYRIGLSVLGRDYAHSGKDPGLTYESFGQHLSQFGSGGMIHDDPDDRPASTFGGTTTIHIGPDSPSSLLLPVIPGPR